MNESLSMLATVGWVVFAIGLIGLIIRRNGFTLVLSLLLMFNGMALFWVSASSYWRIGSLGSSFMFVVVALASLLVIGLAVVMAMVLGQGSPDIHKTKYLRN